MAETQSRYGSLYGRLPENPATASDGKVYQHRVPTRDERRVLIEVEVTPTNGISIAGQHAKHGVSRLVVYASELPSIEERVASAEHKRAWENAVSTFEAQRERWLTNTIGRREETESYRLKRENAMKIYGETSPSIEFCRVYPGGLPPIASLKRIQELSAPETETNRDAKRLEGLITQLVDGLGRAVGTTKKG